MRFAEMLDRKAEEIKAPPLLPAGLYHIRCTGPAESDEVRGGDGTIYDKVTFKLQVVGPIEVDENALAEFGKVAGYNLRQDYLFNTHPDEHFKREQTLNAMATFMRALGTFEEGMTLKEGMTACAQGQCQAEVTHRQDAKDASRFYTEIRRTLPL